MTASGVLAAEMATATTLAQHQTTMATTTTTTTTTRHLRHHHHQQQQHQHESNGEQDSKIKPMEIEQEEKEMGKTNGDLILLLRDYVNINEKCTFWTLSLTALGFYYQLRPLFVFKNFTTVGHFYFWYRSRNSKCQC